MSEINRQYLLKQRPVGRIKESDFERKDSPVPEPGEGEVLVRNLYLSLDPAMRGWMNEGKSYVPPVQLGEVMRGLTVGRVVRSRDDSFSEGDFVTGILGWQDYAAVPGKQLGRAVTEPSLTANLSLMGIAGRTAYFGLLDICDPKAGETVLVSGAAGSVGSIVGQIARIKGCRVIGIAGTDAKCAWLVDELGFDGAVNYKTEDLYKALRAKCPDGVDVFFDNVGGETLDTVLRLINLRARISICGAISTYNATEMPPGPQNIRSLLVNRARMEGFIIFDYADRFAEADAALADWHKDGRLKIAEDIVDGLDEAPRAINRLFDGTNTGKLIVRIADEAG
ncbi:MAG: NADP-dependent oxidoreductase [Rhodospirillales bacterium]|nr:NADP-dependent oxidoreductase [Rhodospirillales bacterium]MCW8863109.1 NADP-dependent oxidoreductase [Rhodospirillales bacterium]